MKTLKDVYLYALEFYGKPYIWGGEGPIGYDCSGFIQAVLRKFELDPKGDQTADGLYRYFLENGELNQKGIGSLVFFGKLDRVVHLGFCIDPYIMIHAGGGSPNIRTVVEAKKAEAFIKIQPINYRQDIVAFIRPNYLEHGIGMNF